MSEKTGAIEVAAKSASITEMENWLINRVAEHLSMDSEKISIHEELVLYGLDSMSAIMISGDIEEKLNVELPSTTLWDYPTIHDIMLFLKDKM
ncbi:MULTISPECIES: acyl carrier protein [Aquimarina]|uniref:Acyl carrier protein n=1 Tax=Aquimarina algiphila TaxID=2047982 RepID=A0A554VM11_9FLAO|nr:MULTISPECIES: acyl carrier protein [Aquimarina]TSE09245.1 acyl carrier protein [Aquimarina algiphila]